MIIKIEGMPDGQKIKHIKVDIVFEDDAESPAESRSIDLPPIEKEVSEIAPREKKEIPPEMQDLEF